MSFETKKANIGKSGRKVTGFLNHGKQSDAIKELAQVSELIKTNQCSGIGEIGIRHYDKGCGLGATQPESVMKNLNDPVLRDLIAIADKNRMPIFFHYEPSACNKEHDSKTAVSFYQKVCKEFPNAKVVASHTGMMAPQDLEAVLLACSNAYSDIKPIMKPLGWQGLEPPNNVDMELFEDIAQLIESYPDRFMIGTDWKHGHPYYSDRPFGRHMTSIREMIGSLDRGIQDQIAYKTCDALMGK